ncbi:MAG: S41 family peptidase [Chitinophagaceae bacterium]
MSIFFLSGYSQDLSHQQVKRYSDFGKVWGLMKYYHPNLASGNLSWNDTLRNYLFKVKVCKSDKEFNSLLETLFRSCGSYPLNQKFAPTKKYHKRTFQTEWISESPILDSKIKSKLENLISFYRPQKNILVVKGSIIYDTTVIHNNEKDNLITLIIAWNIIKYEAPHLKLAETNWDSLLEHYIPIAATTKSPEKFEYIMAKMLSKIRDSHNFMTLPNYENNLGNFYLPFNIAFVENKNIVKQIDTAACKNFNIHLGDIVETIDGENVNDLRDSFRNISRGGHIKVIDNEVDEFYLPKVKGNQPIKITFKKADNSLTTSDIHPIAKRKLYDPIKQKAKNKFYTINDTISYINLMYSAAKDIRNALNKFHNSKCIIIDNRGYPSGKTYSALFNRLTGNNDRIINYYKQNNTTFTGTFPEKFLSNPYYHLRGYANVLKPFYKKFKGKIIVLFDESTLSHAEFRNQGFTFIKNNVITVGRNTAGADGAIYFRHLPGKIRIGFTGDIVIFPNGMSTQKKGMAPDYYVEDTIDSIRKGEDDILKKAIEIAAKYK